MYEVVVEQEPKGAIARVARLRDSAKGREYETPTAAPLISTGTEGRSLLRLLQAGWRTQAIVVPLSRRRSVKSELGSLVDPALSTLDGFVQPHERPIILVDPEAEALSCPGRAREAFLDDKGSPPPNQALPLLNSALRSESSGSKRPEYGKVWDQSIGSVGLASVGEWYERMTREAGASSYLAPTPVIRASLASVRRAFGVAWRFVDAAAQTFDNSGPHFVLHGELFSDTSQSAAARTAFLAHLQKAYATPTPRRLPYVSLKVLPNGSQFFYGTGASQSRRNLSEFLVNACHHARALGGLLITHNLGSWSLGGLDSGSDVVTFRGDARPLYIDPLWRRQKRKAAARSRRKHPRHRTVAPFDPDALCDGSVKEFKASWMRNNLHAFPSDKFVPPEPFWEWPFDRRFEYRTRQIIASLVAVGREYREALASGEPICDAVKSRVARMRDQDALLDLCPTIR
jgi:hypothetical protein